MLSARKVDSVSLRTKALMFVTTLMMMSTSCTLRSESVDLVLKGSSVESAEAVALDPVFLSRQKQAETLFFGFESTSTTATSQNPLPVVSFDDHDLDENEEDVIEIVDSEVQMEGFPLLWPVPGRVTSNFGMRKGRLHAGIDIGSPRGTPIRASASGQVLSAMNRQGYGLTVIVGHDHDAQTLYAHMMRMNVKPGEYVKPGQVIGFVGRTGRATGYHLHFETRVAGGIPQNPLRFLPKVGPSGTVGFNDTIPGMIYVAAEELVTR